MQRNSLSWVFELISQSTENISTKINGCWVLPNNHIMLYYRTGPLMCICISYQGLLCKANHIFYLLFSMPSFYVVWACFPNCQIYSSRVWERSLTPSNLFDCYLFPGAIYSRSSHIFILVCQEKGQRERVAYIFMAIFIFLCYFLWKLL